MTQSRQGLFSFVVPISLPATALHGVYSSLKREYSRPILARLVVLDRVPGSVMAFLSHLNPLPAFPSHTGPHQVGTQDVEIPVSELHSPASSPESTIPTVSFRIFYPSEPNSPKEFTKKAVHWLPSPQGGYFQGYAKFLGSSPRLATFLSYVSADWNPEIAS